MDGEGQTRSQQAFPLFLYGGGIYMSWSKLKQQLESFQSCVTGKGGIPRTGLSLFTG